MSGAFAAVQGIRSLREGEIEVRSLQEYHQRLSSVSVVK
jgi:hypothetical protein